MSSAIVQASETLRELEVAQTHLNALVRGIEQWRAVLRNSQNRICQLPEDVLCCIFDWVARDDSRSARIYLSHVCARWRAIGHGRW